LNSSFSGSKSSTLSSTCEFVETGADSSCKADFSSSCDGDLSDSSDSEGGCY
jgi:hypothetical protein